MSRPHHLNSAPPGPAARAAVGCGDYVRIEGVRALGTHGVLEFEHHRPQPFEIDVALRVDVSDAADTDDLTHTVDYAHVAQIAIQIVEGPHVDLIETMASRIAETALAAFPRHVEDVQVTVHKPHAPVGLPFRDVTVTVNRLDERAAVVALGANLGDSASTLAGAVRQLRELPRTTVTAVSPLVETDPVGGPEQPAYLNAVAVLHTTLRPTTLMRALLGIEARHGRVRDVRWGARTLDLDLIQYGDPSRGTDLTGDTEILILPHPRAHQRDFVLFPWLLADPQAHLRLPPHVADEAGRVAAVRDLVSGAGGWPDGVRLGPSWPVIP